MIDVTYVRDDGVTVKACAYWSYRFNEWAIGETPLSEIAKKANPQRVLSEDGIDLTKKKAAHQTAELRLPGALANAAERKTPRERRAWAAKSLTANCN